MAWSAKARAAALAARRRNRKRVAGVMIPPFKMGGSVRRGNKVRFEGMKEFVSTSFGTVATTNRRGVPSNRKHVVRGITAQQAMEGKRTKRKGNRRVRDRSY